MKRNALKRLRAIFDVLWVTYQHTNRVLNLTRSGRVDPGTSREVYTVARTWLQELTRAIHCDVYPEGTPFLEEPCLFVSNHVGYLDIPVLMSLTHGSFVAKKEIEKWPIFGRAAKSYGTVFVDRSDPIARKKVGHTIAEYVSRQRKSVILFPEGTSSMMGVDWKRGAFSIAKEFQIPVQPICISYKPHAPVSYYGNHTFMAHLWSLLKENKIEAHVEFFEPRTITDPEKETPEIQKLVQQSLEKRIKQWNS